MPNGQSGGFMISKARLQSIVERFPGSEKLANSGKSGGTASEMLEALRGYKPWFDSPDEEVVVHEVEGSWYLIMLSAPPGATVENGVLKPSDLWFDVGDESLMFIYLVEYHTRSLAQTADE